MGDQQQRQGGQDRNQGNQNQRDQQAQQGGNQDRNQGGQNVGDKGRMGNKPGQGGGGDQGKVGLDTDGDGKTVQPGQKPGQSHGTGQK